MVLLGFGVGLRSFFVQCFRAFPRVLVGLGGISCFFLGVGVFFVRTPLRNFTILRIAPPLDRPSLAIPCLITSSIDRAVARARPPLFYVCLIYDPR